MPDTGIFSDLEDRVRVSLPTWLSPGPADIVESESGGRFAIIDHTPIGFAPPASPTTFRVPSFNTIDHDGDGIPDALDILLGAKKTVLNGAAYKSTYRIIPYPGGDIPRDEGVCTDVVIRSLRNAGFDLQKAIHEDATARPGAYPGITKLDRNIDHRRVRNLIPYFKKYWTSLPVDPKDRTVPWLPGDIVFLDTMNDSQPEHLGVVSDALGPSGLPLIVNNWTDGFRTSEMDLLTFVPVRGRFRVPMRWPAVPAEQVGVAGLLHRRGLSLGPEHKQLVLVVVPSWSLAGGWLRRYERGEGNRWEEVGAGRAAVIGAGGLAIGRGLGAAARPIGLQAKKEGDLRSPEGAFTFGTAFGREQTPPFRGPWPYRTATSDDRWVDDPASPHYNAWKREGEGVWASAEDLSQYRLAVVVNHNQEPVLPGAGSAIFVHSWQGPASPTLGCTALAEQHVVELLEWLRPDARPVIVQLAGTLFFNPG